MEGGLGVGDKEKYESELRFFPDYPQSSFPVFKRTLDFQVRMGYGRADWCEDNPKWPKLPDDDMPFHSPDSSLWTSFRSLKPEYPPYIMVGGAEPEMHPNWGWVSKELTRRSVHSRKLEHPPHTMVEGPNPGSVWPFLLPELEKSGTSMYTLVCCFFVPYLWNDYNLQAIRATVRVFKELCTIREDVQMQVVVKMRSPWMYGDSAHKQFESFFHSASHSKRINYSSSISPSQAELICHHLKLDSATPKFALIDPAGMVLQRGNLSFFNYLTADCFPFTPDKIPAKPGSLPRKFPSQLGDIFSLDPSTIQIFKLVGDSSPVPLSHLQGKHVALYLCRDGFFIPKLDRVHRECLRRGHEYEFEIVLVYLDSLYFIPGKNKEFVDIINEQLTNWNISGWIVPFTEWVAHRLENFERMFTDDDRFTGDRLIMVGPDGRFVDPYAKSVLSLYGTDYFPFTRDCLVSKLVEELEKVNLVPLLSGYPAIRRVGNRSRVPLRRLEGKNVLLYIDFTWGSTPHVLGSLLDAYPSIMGKDSKCEAVFLPMDSDSATATPPPEASGWLVCPFDPEISPSICKDLLHSGSVSYTPLNTVPTLVAFGKNGRISSLRAHELLNKGFAGFPLKGDLRREVIAGFDDADYMNDMRQ